MNSNPLNIPSSIRVLGKDFEVEILQSGDRDGFDGLMELGQHRISIRPSNALGYVQDTLLHEVFHAVDETLGSGLKERQIALMATGVLAVLKDNPEFLAWLTTSSKPASI